MGFDLHVALAIFVILALAAVMYVIWTGRRRAAESARQEVRMRDLPRPRLTRQAGTHLWICDAPGSAIGIGRTPRAAFMDWLHDRALVAKERGE